MVKDCIYNHFFFKFSVNKPWVNWVIYLANLSDLCEFNEPEGSAFLP